MDHETGTSTDERLEQVESQMHALMGHVKALEYGLRLLIASHPAPEVVQHALDRITAQALSSAATGGLEPHPLYQAALHQGLGIISEQISESVRRRT
ncbi:hypothetical protein [Stenotrophomonas rhizophila]|uniref:hypothetical protein n=1 Tax=Stenotrophomonas rhizophila TaxID=216778 RepID=UPI0028A5EFF5|nr:hypothetical protein [Stenotrophomonas rhizophila]